MMQYGIYTKFTAHPGRRNQLAEILSKAAILMAGVTGCHLYIVNEDATHGDTLWVTELWTSKADHDASLTVDGVRGLVSKAMPLLAGRPEQITLVHCRARACRQTGRPNPEHAVRRIRLPYEQSGLSTRDHP